MKRICKSCNQEYETPPSQRKHFCSAACAGVAKRKRVICTCVQCNKEFEMPQSRSNSQYCSKSCFRTAVNLTNANPSYHRDISGENNPMYRKGLKGSENPMYGKRKDKSPRWSGGIKKRKDGYILQVASDNHPHPCDVTPSGTKYVLQHRLVMERKLGRYLRPNEVVHHKDENPSNNDASNLEVYESQSDHMRLGHKRVV